MEDLFVVLSDLEAKLVRSSDSAVLANVYLQLECGCRRGRPRHVLLQFSLPFCSLYILKLDGFQRVSVNCLEVDDPLTNRTISMVRNPAHYSARCTCGVGSWNRPSRHVPLVRRAFPLDYLDGFDLLRSDRMFGHGQYTQQYGQHTWWANGIAFEKINQG